MKKFILIFVSIMLIAAVCAACTPGALVDTLNGLGGATPGNGFFFATPGGASNAATPGNVLYLASPSDAATPGNAQ